MRGAVSGAGDPGVSNTDQVSSPRSLLPGGRSLHIEAIREADADIGRMLVSDECYYNHYLHDTALQAEGCKV